MANICCSTILAVAVICLQITLVTCQCNWSMDSYGYQNVKDNSNGFLEWNLLYGPLQEDKLSQQEGAGGDKDDCYFVARGGGDGFKALLLSSCYVTPQSSTEEVSISWSVYSHGPNAATLNMYWRPGCLEPRDLPDEKGHLGVSIPGNIADTWLTFSKDIKRNLMQVEMPFQIIFEAVMKGDRNSSISVDDIIIRNAFSLTTANPAVTKPEIDGDPASEAYPTVYQTPSAAGSNGSEPTNATLNFCEKSHIVGGLDNCTFIGLMFAVIPLAAILIVWGVCRIYTRFFRTYEPRGRKNRDDDDDAVSRDMYASNSNLYMNSLTENTTCFTAVTPAATETSNHEKNNLNEGRDGKYKKDSDTGKKSPIMPHKYEKRKEQTGDFLTVPKKVPTINVTQSVDMDNTSDQAHNVLEQNGPQSASDINAKQADDVVEDHAYNVLESSGPIHYNNTDVQKTEDIDNVEDHTYNIIKTTDNSIDIARSEVVEHVEDQTCNIQEPCGPKSSPEVNPHYDIVNKGTPPVSPIDSQRSSSQKSNSFIEAYASVAVNDASLRDSPQISHYADSFHGDRGNSHPTQVDTYEELNNDVCDQQDIDEENATIDPTSSREDKPLYQTLVDEEGNEDTFL